MMPRAQRMFSFPDYAIDLETHYDSAGRKVDVYLVRGKFSDENLYSDRDYNNAYRFAVQLQEKISAAKEPTGYVKVPLIQIGSLSIYRTVRSQKNRMSWHYIAEDPKGSVVKDATNYIDICVSAVNLECSKLDKTQRGERP